MNIKELCQEFQIWNAKRFEHHQGVVLLRTEVRTSVVLTSKIALCMFDFVQNRGVEGGHGILVVVVLVTGCVLFLNSRATATRPPRGYVLLR